jgi:hypothetical protein
MDPLQRLSLRSLFHLNATTILWKRIHSAVTTPETNTLKTSFTLSTKAALVTRWQTTAVDFNDQH